MVGISFEIDQAEIFKWAFWTFKMIVSAIPWWAWILIILAVGVDLFVLRIAKRR